MFLPPDFLEKEKKMLVFKWLNNSTGDPVAHCLLQHNLKTYMMHINFTLHIKYAQAHDVKFFFK